ncbi:MAG: arsenic efflux protein [Clostridia bacterium]|nr:arsenic efflux protein [Clostridia bacterium]
MHEFFHSLLHALEHTALEALRLLPFLYLSYLLMEFLEHKSGDAAANWLRRSGRIGPLIGGALGVVPQCGFSAAATGLYTGRIVTVGTLLAVYLSTSDEMLPILISHGAPVGFTVRILAVKLVIGVAVGFAVDLLIGAFRKRRREESHPQIEELCEREHCRCGEHYALSALWHTLRVASFVVLFTFALNLTVELVGEERLATLVLNRPILSNLLAAVVGLIPNCASSVVLTELYLGGVVSVGAMLSGLLVNAGIGLALLFRNNRPVRDSVRILLILWCVGVVTGILVDITPLAAWLGI